MASGLGQDDIDKLLADMGVGDTAAPSAPPAPEPKPLTAAVASPAPPAEVKPPTAAVAAKPPTLAVAKPAAAASEDAKPPADALPGSESGTPLDSGVIDDLVKRASEAVARPVAHVSTSSTASGRLAQSEIDKLLAELAPVTREQAKGSGKTGHLSQDDIDKLLGDLEVPAGGGEESAIALPATSVTAKSQEARPGAGAKPQAGKQATSSKGPAGGSPLKAEQAASASSGGSEGPLSQNDIDRMLADLGAGTASVKADKVSSAAVPAAEPQKTRKIPPAPVPVPVADVTAELSPAEIEAIVAKQAASPAAESEAAIAQEDIDALVKQLANATGSPDAQEVADAIAGKADDIDRIQAEAPPPHQPEMTQDAVDVDSVLGHTVSTAETPQMVGSSVTIATVATVEWHAARWLLVAAVLFLGMCIGVLITLTLSVRQLSGELRAGREAEHPAVDLYADKLALALAKLGESDDVESDRGVRWMEELKVGHPEHAGDVGYALARYWRGRKAWQRADKEYSAAVEAAGVDDPRVLLEQADCQTRLGNDTSAIRTIYVLLASEGRWLAEHDSQGRPAAQPDRERNRQAVADAYLVLGRLLARSGEAVAAQPAPTAAAATEPVHGGGVH